MLDDFNREGGIEVDVSLSAERAIRSPDRIIEWRGKPGTMRGDNGPECISGKLLIWAGKRGITIQHIQPQQSVYIERDNRTVRHEWFDQYTIEAIEEAQDSPRNGSGLTTKTAQTWASVAAHPPRNGR